MASLNVQALHVRELSEAREESLSPHAVKSRESRGRRRPEPPDLIRTAFQRDRDRIIHSNAFRRLKHKTQVFIAPQGDHFATRLTHTLEVSQIARTVARALNLNEDLTEAIALGHDLGHTPFGHVGEDVLDELCPGGFRHNEQSLRVVDVVEGDGRGLNLTWEVRDGILNHSKSRSGLFEAWPEVGTLEGEVCRIADIVAYVNHDIDDAVRAGIIGEADLPAESRRALGTSRSERINTMVSDIIVRSWAVRSNGELRGPAISMSDGVREATDTLRRFLFERVYDVQSTHEEARRARDVLRRLYRYFNEHPEKLPGEYQQLPGENPRGVADYIAGMTDQFAARIAETIV
jgi:dGTPase